MIRCRMIAVAVALSALAAKPAFPQAARTIEVARYRQLIVIQLIQAALLGRRQARASRRSSQERHTGIQSRGAFCSGGL